MNGFTIKNYQDTASFELEVIQRGNVDDIDASVRTKYDFQGRTINSTHRWSFGLGEVSWFMDKIISMHENLKGCSSFSSFDEDELFLTIDELGHIDVTVKDGIASYSGRVEFKFQIDQSYLPELIEQLKKFIEANRNSYLSNSLDTVQLTPPNRGLLSRNKGVLNLISFKKKTNYGNEKF